MMRRNVFIVLFVWAAILTLIFFICLVLRCMEIGNVSTIKLYSTTIV